MDKRTSITRLRKIEIWTCMALAVLFGMLVWLQNNHRPTVTVQGAGGVWNLTGIDLNQDYVHLAGPVEYVPRALLTPEEFEASGDIIVGPIPSYCEYLTSRIRLIVPEDGYYEMSGFSDDYGSRYYVNGVWRLDVGMPATTRAENIPTEDFVLMTVQPSGGVIEILQQSSNFVFRENSSHLGWTFGNEASMKKWTFTLYTMHAITIGLCLALFLVNMLLYGFIVNHKAMLWLGLLCLGWAIRLGVTGMRPLLTLIPSFTWPITFRIEYCTFLLALVLITMCNNVHFPGVLPKALRFSVYISQGILALLYLFCDTLFISKTIILCEALGGFFAAWSTICLLRSRVYRLGLRQRLILASLVVVVLGLLLDVAYYNGISVPLINSSVMETAIFIFSFLQLAAILLLTEERIIRAQETETKLTLENAALARISHLREDMMATFSHEMRTPLAVMLGFAQLTAADLRQSDANEQAVRDLDAIAAEARRMNMLVEEMQELSLARVAKEEKQLLDVGPIVAQLCRMYAPITARKNTELTVDIEPSLPLVSASYDGLTQVLFNLLNNADRHARGGKIHVSVVPIGEAIHLSITDTGSGINVEQMPHVFERYFKGEGGGLGMGLSICKDLVDSWGGHISIESTAGKGTTVHVLLSK